MSMNYGYIRILPSGKRYYYEDDDSIISCTNPNCACKTIIAFW